MTSHKAITLRTCSTIIVSFLLLTGCSIEDLRYATIGTSQKTYTRKELTQAAGGKRVALVMGAEHEKVEELCNTATELLQDKNWTVISSSELIPRKLKPVAAWVTGVDYEWFDERFIRYTCVQEQVKLSRNAGIPYLLVVYFQNFPDKAWHYIQGQPSGPPVEILMSQAKLEMYATDTEKLVFRARGFSKNYTDTKTKVNFTMEPFQPSRMISVHTFYGVRSPEPIAREALADAIAKLP